MTIAAGDLSAALRRLIRTHGPIPVAQYMAEANAAYYASRDPLGATGDFVTAPEISQMFGEMVGGWIADLVARAGAGEFALVELGPGRGTLARDALRVLAAAGQRPHLHLVEASPPLRAAQRALLPGAQFHDSPATIPAGLPLLVIANEFFDALPVRQLVKTPQGWRERMVGLDGDRFVPVAGEKPMEAAMAGLPATQTEAAAAAKEGTILETAPAAQALMADLAAAIARQGGALLAIDYGYLKARQGSTLQAVRAHRPVDPFAAPGTADLTAHVDFSALAQTALQAGCQIHGAATQGQFLMALGMGERAAALARHNPAAEAALLEAFRRLTEPDAMGSLFKVLALGAADWPAGAGTDPAAMR